MATISNASSAVTTTIDGRNCYPSKQSERLVIFAGPGKTGSTTIQDTYIKYADAEYQENRLPAFVNWTVPSGHRFVPYCQYMITPDDRIRRRRVTSEKKRLERRLSKLPTPQNIFWACEFSASIYDKDINGKSVTDTLKALGNRCPEIIFNYRTPRLDHFVSGWKERTTGLVKKKFRERSLYDFVCHEDMLKEFQETTRDYGNVLRGAINYRKKRTVDGSLFSDWPVTIIDMGGAAKAGRDVTHVIACDIRFVLSIMTRYGRGVLP